MTHHRCPCCDWNALVPDDPGEAMVVCAECGQCLHVPEPWSDQAIRSCDTRPLVGPPRAPGTAAERTEHPVQVPPELTCRIPRPAGEDKPSHFVSWGVIGIVLGLFVASGVLWSDRAGNVSPWYRWFLLCGGALILVSGITVLWGGLRKGRRQRQARIVPVPASFPREGYDLGTPFAYHRTSSLARAGGLVMGSLVCAGGAISLAMVLCGQAEPRFLEVGVVCLAGGLCGIWQALRTRSLRIWVFPKGMVLFGPRRVEVWPWDEVEAVWLDPDKSVQPAVGYACTLLRQDGERCTFGLKVEYLENQLGVRVQHELCRRLLPRMRATLRAGGGVGFGSWEVCPDGLRGGDYLFRTEDITGVSLEGEHLILQTQDGRRYRWQIAGLPNVAVFLALVRDIRQTALAEARV